MSFGRTNNFPDYGATEPRFGGARSSQQQQRSPIDIHSYNELCDKISCNIFSINNNVTALEKASKEVGTQADTPFLRDQIHATRQGTKELVALGTKYLQQLTTVTSKGGREYKLQAERVRNEFRATVQRYGAIQKVLDPKMKQAAMQDKQESKNMWGVDEDEEKQSLINAEKVQQQYQIQQELQFEQAMLLEREERVRQIESDMLDVNKVFLDLAAMVREQGDYIGTIEENISTAAYNVEEAEGQLLKARNYQKAYRTKLCFFVLILVIIAVIVAIVVGISVNK